MAYSLTTAASPKALLAAILTFAAAQGWTTEYNNASGASGSVGGQIALSSGNCHIAIGEQSASLNPIAVTGALGSFNDGRISMALATSITPANVQYWGHPGSLVTSATDTDRCIINDVWGPMSEVHFFGDADYIICAIKCGASRYTCFGFGNVDVLGMAADAAGFCFSNYHQFWDTANAGGAGTPGNTMLTTPSHFFPATSFNVSGGGGLQIYIPAGLLDTSFGFSGADQIVSKQSTSGATLVRLCYTSSRIEQGAGDNSYGSAPLDHMTQIRPTLTTGGMPLYSLPVIYRNATLALSSYLGNLPAIRMCRMTNIIAGELITYGSEEYLVFPWKQKGTLADAGSGGTYNNQPNTYDLGWAIKKIT